MNNIFIFILSCFILCFPLFSTEVVLKGSSSIEKNGDSLILKFENTKEEKQDKSEMNGWWSPANAMTICAAVLIFGVIVIGLTSYLSGKDHGEEYNRFNMIVLIIIASIFLITAGYSEQQITPVIGLLGTIVGYVLGKNKNK